jgi:hypothetical protein
MNDEQHNLMRMAELLSETGWTRQYALKLVDAGVIHQLVPYEGAWPWYYREEIQAMVTGRKQKAEYVKL